MDDTLICPICDRKFLSSKYANMHLKEIDKIANYTSRICTKSMNHVLSFWTDQDTNKVDYIRISLEPNNSKVITIDFHNEKSKISMYKNSDPQYIHLQRTFEPDFPSLENLRKQVNLFILFS